MRNKNIINDDVVDTHNVKLKQPVLNLSENSTPTNNPKNKPKPAPTPYQRKFTPLGQSLKSTFKELLPNKLITLPDTQDFKPQVKPSWWNDTYHCKYHRSKGHRTNDYKILKNLVQDLLDKGDIIVEGHKTNHDHEYLKISSLIMTREDPLH